MNDTPMKIAQHNYAVKQAQKIAYEKTLKAKAIKYVIEFGEKVDNNTLSVRDALPVFITGMLIGELIGKVLWIVVQ